MTEELKSTFSVRKSTLFLEDHHSEDEGSGYHSELNSELVETAQETPAASEKPGGNKARVYYIDWMRIIAIYLVVCFHVVQALDDMVGLWPGAGRLGQRPDDSARTDPTHERIFIENFQTSSLMVGMPLFFHISGRAQGLGRPAKNLAVLLLSRFQRLFIPFIVCYCVLIPVWMWIYYPEAPDDVQGNLFKFEVWYWTNFFPNPAWLWFLPVLLIVTVLSAPGTQFADLGKPLDGGISIITLVLLVGLLIWFEFSWVFALCSIAGPLVALILSQVVPFPQKSSRTTELSDAMRYWFALRTQAITTAVATIMMACHFEYAKLSASLEFVPALLLFWNFYIQGFCAERWSSGCDALFVVDPKVGAIEEASDSEIAKVRAKIRMYQIPVALLLILGTALCSPVGRRERMLFPAYSASFRFDESDEASVSSPIFATWHLVGTWCYLGICLCLGQAYLNNEGNSFIYQHASASTMVVYIFHWMFLKLFAVWVLDTLNMKGSFIWKLIDPILLFTFSVGCSLGVYVLLLKVPMLGKFFGV